MASEIRVNSLTNRSGLSTVSITDAGLNAVGIITAHNFKTGTTNVHSTGVTAADGVFTGNVSVTGNLNVSGTLTYEDVTNIDAVGVITARSDLDIADSIRHLGDSNTKIRFPAADTFTVETGGAENARFTSSSIAFKAPDGGNRYFFGEMGNSASAELSLYNSSDAQKVRIAANNASFFNGGNIGIGENNPQSSLVIKKSNNSGVGPELVLNNSSGSYGDEMSILFSSAGTPRSGLKGGITSDGQGSGWFSLSTRNPSGTYGERIRVNSSGYVGINETTPDRTLHVNSGAIDTALKLESTDTEVSLELADNTGSSYIGGGGSYLNFYSGGNERLRVDSSGCLRVGNTHSQTTSGQTKRIALGAKANIWGWTSGNINGALTLADNYYWDGSNNRAIEADEAAYLSLRSGTLRYGTTDSTPSAGGVTGLTEKFRVDTSGNLLLGQGNTSASNLAGGFTKRLSIEGTGAANSSIGLTRNANDDNPPYIYFGKSRGTSAGSNTPPTNGDHLGMVNFAGSRGTGAFGDSVNLRVNAEGNFSSSSTPGRFSVWTTPVNSTSPQNSFQVDSAGAVTAPRNVSWSYSRQNSGASWGANSGATYPNRQYRSPLPLFGTSATNYDTHNALSTFTSGSGTGIKFTAPVGGKYLVMLNMSSVKNEVDTDWGSIGLMRNTTAQASTGSLDYMLDTMYFPNSTSTGNQLGWGGSVIISLSQNDYIVPYTMSVDKFSSDNQYYFQGYLLG